MSVIDHYITKHAVVSPSRYKFKRSYRNEHVSTAFQSDQDTMLVIIVKTSLTSTSFDCTYGPLSVGLASRLHVCLVRHGTVCYLQNERGKKSAKAGT